MRLTRYTNQASTLIAVIILSAPALADHVKLTPTVKDIAASLNSTLEVLIPRPITPASSGILISTGRADQADFTVAKSQVGTGNSDVIGGKNQDDMGVSLGYRKALSPRWSLDTQFERQRVRRRTAVTPNTIAQASEEEISKTIAYWASMSALYHASITPKISLHAGGGAFVWKREQKNTTGQVTTVDKETGTAPMLQLGVGYRVTPRTKIEGNLQRFFMPGKAIDRVSLGVVINTD